MTRASTGTGACEKGGPSEWRGPVTTQAQSVNLRPLACSGQGPIEAEGHAAALSVAFLLLLFRAVLAVDHR